MDASPVDRPTSGTAEGSRRRLLAMLGVSGATVVATQLHGAAHAGHGPADDVNALHLGAANTAPPDAVTTVDADVEDAALVVDNHSASSSTGIKGIGSVAGVEGVSDEGNGVTGRHTSTTQADETAGVFGEAAFGSGVFGRSAHGVGVQAHCADGPGVLAFGGGGELSPGVLGLGFEDHGVIGQTERPDRAGVVGEAHSCLQRGSEDPEDPCNQPSFGTGVLGKGEAGTGVRGQSDTGTGVEAASTGGQALRVLGRAGFSTAGDGVVPAGQDAVFVADAAAGAGSHVSVTLTSDPDARQVHWVEPTAGGFTVHMTKAPPRQRPRTSFTYLIVEPA